MSICGVPTYPAVYAPSAVYLPQLPTALPYANYSFPPALVPLNNNGYYFQSNSSHHLTTTVNPLTPSVRTNLTLSAPTTSLPQTTIQLHNVAPQLYNGVYSPLQNNYVVRRGGCY